MLKLITILEGNLELYIADGSDQFGDKTPPAVYLNRNWVLRETDPVGKIVERVRAEGHEQSELTYGLEPSSLNNNGGESAPQQPPLPFTINSTTGIISLNETLKGRVSFQ